MIFSRKIIIAMMITLFLLACVGALSYWNAAREENERQRLRQANVILAGIAAISSNMADAESGQRGYLLAGDKSFLLSFEQGLTGLATAAGELQALTADSTDQQRELDVMRPLIQAKVAEMQAELASSLPGKRAPAEGARRLLGLELMTQIRNRLQIMTGEEQWLLQQRIVDAAAATRYMKMGIVFGNMLAAAFLLVAGLSIRREWLERQRVEDAIRISEERFRLIIWDITTYAILTLDPGGYIATWNAGDIRIKGYSAEEIIGQHFSCFYPPEDILAGKPALELNTAASKGRFEADVWRLRKDGARFWANVVITAMRDAEGKLVGFSKVTRDLTERKRAEEEVRELNRSLEHRVVELTTANSELDAFNYSLAHDLRAPMRHIHGFAALLHQSCNDKLSKEDQHLLSTIIKASKEMGALVDELLNFARLGRMDLQHNRVDLATLVEEVRQQLEPELVGRVLAWEIGRLPTVSGDQVLLRQVLMNLVSNAVKYTRKSSGALIEIGSNHRGEDISVFVRDNGAGFDMKYADRLFGVFQRLHRVEDFEGVGIGLANVRRIVERHGGHVWAEGAPGQGATFHFSLPSEEVAA